jgi:hypothetical protein
MIVAPFEQALDSEPPRLLIYGIEGIESHRDAAQCTPLPAGTARQHGAPLGS